LARARFGPRLLTPGQLLQSTFSAPCTSLADIATCGSRALRHSNDRPRSVPNDRGVGAEDSEDVARPTPSFFVPPSFTVRV
jgi:hypothetical protein